MRHASIIRLTFGEESTLGVLLFEGVPLGIWTLEPPWKSNVPDISCIPEGRYIARKSFSPKFQRELWEIQDVPNRSEILLGHVGNEAKDTTGCILLGMFPGQRENGSLSVWQSKDAVRKWLDATEEDQELTVTIRM